MEQMRQTNALKILLGMMQGNQPSEDQADPKSSSGGSTSMMPIMDPGAWAKMGAGNFMPMSMGRDQEQGESPSAPSATGGGKGGGTFSGMGGAGSDGLSNYQFKPSGGKGGTSG